MVNFVPWRLCILMMVILSSVFLKPRSSYPAFAVPTPIALGEASGEDAKNDSCPTDIQKLTASLLQDLPSYSNRVIQRTQKRNQAAGVENFIMTAGEEEFETLDLPHFSYSQTDNQEPEQIFFTVLERQYSEGKIIDRQTYHWLFLVQTDSGWRMVMLFSRFGQTNQSNPPAPPRETTDGVIGHGIQLWLRDCRAKIS